MKSAVILGALGGAVYSLFELYAMVSTVSYSAWNYIHSILYVVFLAALLRLAVGLIKSRQAFSYVVTAVTVASLVFAGLYLLTFWISTAFFVDRLNQLPQFALDYAHHRYTSVKQYLFTGNHYSESMKLQAFSFGITLVFQVVLASGVAWVWQQIDNRLDSLNEEVR